MRRLVIASLAVFEAAVAYGIVATTFELGRDLQRSEPVARVANALAAAPHVALQIRFRLHRRTG